MNSSPLRRLQRHYSLGSGDVLPFLDGIFGVALTLLSASIPEQLSAGHAGVVELLVASAGYVLAGIAVLFYWYKLRRLVQMAQRLQLMQLLLCFLGLLTIVALPKMVALAVRYSGGDGDLLHWTSSQVANVGFFGALILVDGIVLLFALSLRRPGACRSGCQRAVQAVIEAQRIGFLVLLVFGLMELVFIWFNSEYVLLVPLILLAEEVMVARRFA